MYGVLFLLPWRNKSIWQHWVDRSSFCFFLPQFLCLGSIHSVVEADCQGYARGRGLGWLDGGGGEDGLGGVGGGCRVDLIWGSVRGFEWACVGGVSYESRWGQCAWIGVAGKLGWVGPGCTPQCFCVLSHPCVCVYGKEVVVVVWAYVRSCAHIHQWNVKRKEEGSVLGLVVFCSPSLSAAL